MEYCEGGSVADVLHYCKMSFSEKQTVAIAFCVLKGLNHLHEKNITHRDVKGTPSHLSDALIGCRSFLV